MIKIKLNKTRIIFILVLTVALTVNGIFLVVEELTQTQNSGIIIIGIFTTLLFGMYSGILLAKLLEKKAGLTISNDGIYDYSSSSSVGFISWNDIEGIKPVESLVLLIFKQKSVVLILKNPEEYILKGRNRLIRYLLKSNFKHIGSPICIAPINLKVKPQRLIDTIEGSFKANRSNG